MNEQELQQTLTALRAELDRLPESAAGREKMLGLLARVEAQLDPSTPSTPEETLLDGIHQAATEFEVEHPKASALLQRIVHTLSAMGI
jgi:hypothetical protein